MSPASVAQAYRACPEDGFDFEVTSELGSLDLLSGHRRARDALDFGTAMRSEGFNLRARPPQPRHARHDRALLAERSHHQPAPPDIAYRYNFDDPARPVTCRCPPAPDAC
ncbi:hypothetical protein DSL92_05425 [Billgrantia gudaonensis]|uniref:Uncharacterized protein n=1 Tax=Billgrantia gudaonensis TaxID=376427 RepID=A0A3S0QRR4_9GAMM|nr:hypothetical protein DSL92_05425 [Halomonas gudaonensis]